MEIVNISKIEITDTELVNAKNNVVNYLLSFETKRFLYEIYKSVNLPTITQEGYGGWERSDDINFRGHFIGHYLSALSLAYHSEKNTDLKKELVNRIKILINGLEKAQNFYGSHHPESFGYVSAFPESVLNQLEKGIKGTNTPEKVLVPWYNLHKILAGLISVSEALEMSQEELSKQALKIASYFGDYIYRKTYNRYDKETILKTEYGGMNDALYSLFYLTGKTEHYLAATTFDEWPLFEQLSKNKDVLPGKHANTMIPKLIGALNRYSILKRNKEILSKEEQNQLDTYFLAAKNFWDIVVEHHTYCTGGNSQGEHFHLSDRLYEASYKKDGALTCETCNSYNMLKLSKQLYMLTTDSKYLDYFERTFINSILASQNPETGMMMYFQPMGAGYNKVYNRPYLDFWCCTGTGIESFSKLGDFFYLLEGETILINFYFSNMLKLTEKNMILIQETDRSLFKSKISIQQIDATQNIEPLKIKIRIPSWSDNFEVKMNGVPVLGQEKNGFFSVPFDLDLASIIEITFFPRLAMTCTLDNKNYVAFTYGPYVLSGDANIKNDYMSDPNGILVQAGTKNEAFTDVLTLVETVEHCQIPVDYEVISSKESLFSIHLKHIKEKLIFSPYYQVYNKRYGIYFNLLQGNEKSEMTLKEQKTEKNRKKTIYQELIHFDENNSEYKYNLKFKYSDIGVLSGKTYRFALVSGYFSYLFPLSLSEETFTLSIICHSSDCGKSVLLTVNNCEELTYTVASSPEEKFIEKQFILNKDLVKNNRLKLKISSLLGETPKIFGIILKKND